MDGSYNRVISQPNAVVSKLNIVDVPNFEAAVTIPSKLLLFICRQGLKASLLLLPLVGGTWIFGFLHISVETRMLSYLFVLLNSSQVRNH